MLRTPPFAMMNYYTNLFLSAQFIFSGYPYKAMYLNKEIRRIECVVGVLRTSESDKIQAQLREINREKGKLKNDEDKLELEFNNADEKRGKELEKVYQELMDRKFKLHKTEYGLLLKLHPLMNLKTIETYCDNNMDLKSFFKEGGRRVTQMELQGELDLLKRWVYMEAVQLMPHVRFTKLE